MEYIITDALAVFQAFACIRSMGAGSGEVSALLLDGPPGVGKTFLARIIAKRLGAEVMRFQFFDGCGKSEMLFDDSLISESNPTGAGIIPQAITKSYSGRPVVLILDEIDKAGPSVDGFLLNFLSEARLSVPRLGDLEADTSNLLVVITKNDVRDVSNPLLRRCRVVYLQWPTLADETAVIQQYLPWMTEAACATFLEEPHRLRKNPEVIKPPATPELIRFAGDLPSFVAMEPDPTSVGRIYRGAIAQNPSDHRFIPQSDAFFGAKILEMLSEVSPPQHPTPRLRDAVAFLDGLARSEDTDTQ